MKEKWDEQEIRDRVRDYVMEHQIKAVFTFDSKGISGHPNHIAISLALQALKVSPKTDTSIKLYQLESVNLFRKYSSFIDIIWSMLSDFMFTKFNMIDSFRTMAKHRSQFVYYRKLSILFSRYSLVNTYPGFTFIQV